ncbi:uncharacterized protein V6R79_014410 [Siganus canaliculatus]
MQTCSPRQHGETTTTIYTLNQTCVAVAMLDNSVKEIVLLREAYTEFGEFGVDLIHHDDANFPVQMTQQFVIKFSSSTEITNPTKDELFVNCPVTDKPAQQT